PAAAPSAAPRATAAGAPLASRAPAVASPARLRNSRRSISLDPSGSIVPSRVVGLYRRIEARFIRFHTAEGHARPPDTRVLPGAPRPATYGYAHASTPRSPPVRRSHAASRAWLHHHCDPDAGDRHRRHDDALQLRLRGTVAAAALS